MHTASNALVAHDAVTVSRIRRTFTIVGTKSAPRRRPLVLVFHGSKQTADSHRRFTGDALAPLASAGKAVVAYLDGYRGNWNDARRESSFPARLKRMDDVAFTRAVIERLASGYDIDPDQVILVGYSNGGQMVLRLLHETPDVAAAAIIIAATMPAPENFLAGDPDPAPIPTPITLVHGTLDRIVPFEGGSMSRWARAMFRVGGRTLSATDTAAYFAERNGISIGAVTSRVPTGPASSSGTSVVRTLYSQPATPPVVLYEIRGGGHTIPGEQAAPRFLGRTNTDVTLFGLVQDAVDDLTRDQRTAGST